MTPEPTIAMLIPAHNASQYLPRLLDSAIRQTQSFDEIWVYDDFSADDTAAVAERYGARIVRGQVNRGCSHGKNRLAAETKCDWIHFHDADDELMPNFVEHARKWMSDARFDVVLFAFEQRDDCTGDLMGIRRFDPAELSLDARAYTLRSRINPFCGLYRREAILAAGGYDEDPLVLYSEDVAFHVRMAFHGLSFAADEAVTVINHQRDGSMSSANPIKCYEAHYHILRKTAALEGADRYFAEIAQMLWILVARLATGLDWRTADAAADLAIRLAGPSSAPTSSLFKVLCHISPHLAIRMREWLIRALKPSLRDGSPGWRAGFR